MRQSTYRDKVYAAFGIVAQSVKGDAAGRFRFITACYHFYGFLRHFGCKVIEHDTVYAAQIEYLLQFVEVAYFNFYLEVLALLLAIFLGTGNGLVDTAGEVNMIVFQQNHVEQTDSMVYAATYLHSHLF